AGHSFVERGSPDAEGWRSVCRLPPPTREGQSEGGTLPDLALHRQLPTHAVRQLAADRQAQPRPSVGLRVALIDLSERLEDPFLVLRRDAGSVVRDPDLDLILGDLVRDLDPSPPPAKLDRVREEVGQNLAELVRVRIDGEVISRLRCAANAG